MTLIWEEKKRGIKKVGAGQTKQKSLSGVRTFEKKEA